MPTPVELRKACYAILDLARTEKDVGVKRVLAGHAFTLAQQAQLVDRTGTGTRPSESRPAE